MNSFGKRLKKLREARKLSQEKLAERCNVSSSCVSRWETDTLEPNYKNILALAKALEVEVVDLFPTSGHVLPQSFIIRETVSALEQLSEQEQEFFWETIIRYQKMKESSKGSAIIP
ncbi:helix-turn-helix transcriptional regulator [Oscillospiraceae bacterium 21-37]